MNASQIILFFIKYILKTIVVLLIIYDFYNYKNNNLNINIKKLCIGIIALVFIIIIEVLKFYNLSGKILAPFSLIFIGGYIALHL
jgi:hypothetical protein